MPTDRLTPGLKAEIVTTVDDKLVVKHMGGDGVLSTPSMIGLMERAGIQAVQAYLPEGHTTVGFEVHVKHFGATPKGEKVTVRAELLEVDGRKLRFKVEAHDEHKKVGDGTHRRAIIAVQGKGDLARTKEAPRGRLFNCRAVSNSVAIAGIDQHVAAVRLRPVAAVAEVVIAARRRLLRAMAAPVPAPITAPIAAPRRPPMAPPTMAPPTPPTMAPPSVFCATAGRDGVAKTDATNAAIAKFRIISRFSLLRSRLRVMHRRCGRSMAEAVAYRRCPAPC